MDPFRKYIITQIIKQSGKIPRATSLIDNAVAQLKIRLKNAGENISKYTDPKQITQFFNKEKSYWNQQVEQAIKAKDIGTKFSKQKGPFEGFKPKIVPKPKDIKSKLDKQNKESKQRFKDKMKNPEDLAGGGIAGMVGERMGYDNGKIVKRKNEEMGPLFETNDPQEAFKEVIQRLINIDPAKIPLTDKLQLMFDLNRIKAGGSTDLFGGELNFGYNKDFDREGEGIGFEWKKQFAGGGIAGMLGEPTYADDNHRVPYGKGKLVFDAARRKFLQLLGAGAAGTAAAKSGLLGLLKGGGKKEIVESLTSVPIGNAPGMPPWFKPLVNQVIKEGDDVSKRFATQERQVVHQSTLPDSKTDVIVTQNLDTGHVSVDVGMGKHGFAEGHLGQPVRLEYKAAEDIIPDLKTGKGGGKTKEEFWVEEAEFTGGNPENVKFEESTFEKFGDHGSNFDEVEMFATGKVKKKTAKESIKAERAHWVPEGDDMASGGRVSLSSGGLAGMLGE